MTCRCVTGTWWAIVRGVVYHIYVACPHVYVGQRGRCLEERALEHQKNTENNLPPYLLARHRSSANNCYPCWRDCSALDVEHDMQKRIIKETLQTVCLKLRQHPVNLVRLAQLAVFWGDACCNTVVVSPFLFLFPVFSLHHMAFPFVHKCHIPHNKG